MTGLEFKSNMSVALKGCDGRKIVNSMFDGYKGMLPVLVELRRAQDAGEKMTSGEIAEKFSISTARVSRLLNTLEEKDYIMRMSSPKDGRVTYVLLTDVGLKELDRIDKASIEILDKLIGDIDDSKLEVFFEVLKNINNNICKL